MAFSRSEPNFEAEEREWGFQVSLMSYHVSQYETAHLEQPEDERPVPGLEESTEELELLFALSDTDNECVSGRVLLS